MSLVRSELARIEGILLELSPEAATCVEQAASEIRSVVIKAGDGGYCGLLLASLRARAAAEDAAAQAAGRKGATMPEPGSGRGHPPVICVGLPIIAKLLQGFTVDLGYASLIPDSTIANQAALAAETFKGTGSCVYPEGRE